MCRLSILSVFPLPREYMRSLHPHHDKLTCTACRVARQHVLTEHLMAMITVDMIRGMSPDHD